MGWKIEIFKLISFIKDIFKRYIPAADQTIKDPPYHERMRGLGGDFVFCTDFVLTPRIRICITVMFVNFNVQFNVM